MESIHALAHPPMGGTLGGAMQTSGNAMARGSNAIQQTANDIANTAGPEAINAGGGHVGGVKRPDLIHSMTHLSSLANSYKLNAKVLSTVDDVSKVLMNMGADSAAHAS